MLVLIARDDITKSTWIPQELELASTYKRKIVPINVANTLDGISLDAPPWDALRDLSRIEESAAVLEKANPSDDVAPKIEQTYEFTRKRVKTIGGLFAAGLLFFAMSVAAAGSAVYTVKVRNQAKAETLQLRDEAYKAKQAEAEAKGKEAIAKEARNNALTELTTVTGQSIRPSWPETRLKRDARKETQIAAKQREETAKQTEIAATKRKSAFALYLNQQAQQAYEQNPELGVRLDLEALEQVPSDDDVSRKMIGTSLRNLAKEARVGTVGVGDVEDVMPVPAGYLSILPVDQGIEHSAGASFAPNPQYFDPENIVKLAIEGGCNAVASTFGVVGTVARKYTHKIPFIDKINHNELLTLSNKFDQVLLEQSKRHTILGPLLSGPHIFLAPMNRPDR